MSIRVQVKSTKYIVNHGETVTFECKITGGTEWLTPFVKWRRTNKTYEANTHEIKETRKEWDDANYILTTFLTIKRASRFDSGVYNCLVLRHISADIELDVLRFRPAKIRYNVAHYEPCTLECKLKDFTEYSIEAVTWLRRCKKSGKITLLDGKTEGHSVLKTFLTIESSEEEDSGFYICIIRIEDQELRSDEIELCVFGIVADNDEYDIIVGSNAVLKFRWIDLPLSSAVTLFVNGNDFESYNLHKCNCYSKVGTEPTVYIFNAELRDDGYYSFVAHYEYNGSRFEARIAWTRLNVRAIVMKTLEYTVDYGATLTLECSLKGTPNAKSVFWKRKMNDNTEIVSIDGSKFIGSTVSNPSLVIINVNNSNMGSYFCTVMFGRKKECLIGNEVSVYLQDTLTVQVPKPKYTVYYGQHVTLKCSFEGGPPAIDVAWHKSLCKNCDKISVPDTNNSKYIPPTVKVPSLTILSADGNDSGYYTCEAKGYNGRKVESPCIELVVIILEPFSVQIDPQYRVLFGENVKLKCHISGKPSPTSFLWKKDGKDLSNACDYKYVASTVNNPYLTIINADNDDGGTYTCYFYKENNDLLKKAHTLLSVIYEKISVKVNNTLYNVQLHRSVTLKCSVSGTPSPYSVSWIKVTDGTETVLKNMPFQEGINIYEISIDNATDKDAGIYQCKAMSKEREIQSENIHVFVFGGYQTILDSFKLASGNQTQSSVQNSQKNEADLKYIPDTNCLSKRQKMPKIADIQKLKVGMQVGFSRAAYNHHGIVSNVYGNSYEIIHMTGDKDTLMDKQFHGIAEIRKEKKYFDDKGMTFYDYGESSLDRIFRSVHAIGDDNSVESIVSKRACFLYEAFQTFRNEVYYKMFSFNCEHFASYCATGLAFCKQ